MTDDSRTCGGHPSSFIPHPSSLILHPSSFILHPSSFILHPSSFGPATPASDWIDFRQSDELAPALEVVLEVLLELGRRIRRRLVAAGEQEIAHRGHLQRFANRLVNARDNRSGRPGRRKPP